MDNLIELTKEDRKEILERIEEVKNIRESVSDEVKRIIDDFAEKSENLFDDEKIKLNIFEQMISDLNKIKSGLAEIDFAVYGLNEIKTRITKKQEKTEVTCTPIFRRPQYRQHKEVNVDDFETTKENTEKLRSIIKQVIRPVIVSVKTKPRSEKNEVYSYIYRIERHVHLYSVTRNRENFDRIGSLLESLKGIPVIGQISQVIHSIKSAMDLINNIREDKTEDDDYNEPKKTTTEKRMREMIKRLRQLKSVNHAVSA